jgi:uncharacterized protein (DUF433 family)
VPNTFRLIGRGVYSPAEAYRLTGVPPRRIRRWTLGYYFDSRGRTIHSPPVIPTELPTVLGTPALDFADLLEIRFLNAFRESGVSWKAIRIASQRARELLGLKHPFSSRRFSTDGQTILAQFVTETGDEVMLDLVRRQYEFKHIISRYLFGQIDFDDDTPARWWPMEGSRDVVVDPRRAFGAPIVSKEGVPTRILARAVIVEGSVDRVAELYDVAPPSVEAAVKYESTRPLV